LHEKAASVLLKPFITGKERLQQYTSSESHSRKYEKLSKQYYRKTTMLKEYGPKIGFVYL